MKTKRLRLDQQLGKATFALLLVMVAGACAQNRPSIAQVRDHLQTLVKDTGEGRIRLKDITELDTQTVYLGGSEGYSLLWKADIEFLEDCYWPISPDPLKTELASARVASGSEKNLRKKGEQATIKGKYLFEKTEAGWNLTGSEYL